MTSFSFNNRITTLQKTITPGSAVLLADPQHIRYLTGFESLAPGEREAFLVMTNDSATLLYASFSPVEKQSIIEYVPKCSVAAVLEKIPPITSLAADLQALTATEYQALKKSSLTLSSWNSEALWQQRMRKDKQELALISHAVEITKNVLEQILATLAVGMTEHDVRRNLDAQLLLAGADGTAFPTIVAFGENSALPHHQPTDKKLEKEMAVLIDCGAQVAGYCADMTRTVWFGDTPDPEFVKIDAIVHQAFGAAQVALKQEKPTAKSIDTAARQIISEAGYGQQFIHTTGHGLGLSIHEPPSLSARNEQLIKASMVITIEPGIYLTGKFGVRFEETQISNLQ
ncbi:MAG: M24 family metallopeptidase [Candidatus Pacebacteria bacterium]|nr:M24 family metallopeptidase [Candidatus Paceibacterota bacterium]PIR61242.1 MAG: hypothetical protein COU68_00440 [Candidatus Pacebacteria bacterium CG10_big_fil_rev_8_21_14_0_10_45_6]